MQSVQTFTEYFGLKKSEIKSLAEQAIESVLENGNALEIAESLSAMEDFIKQVRGDKRITDYVREEVTKYGKEYSSSSGCKIELAETGTKYDFSKCNDPELVTVYPPAKSSTSSFKVTLAK